MLPDCDPNQMMSYIRNIEANIAHDNKHYIPRNHSKLNAKTVIY